ncbi:YceI family protein [Pseudofrankia inefficax]|uniref:YceI family protein n=1 Tax=Pseudofrankia inefficax (strain DSM 45817 / CECT 9037 / DDB 130130 / EuI1c) TaxID=298654 RepID=E3IXF8_PSEI1|nr:YceI family protein [Pseudofrankia inefficax]ADP78975.1 YceI family protein [Pseudofrankia inefficax]
MTTPSVSNPSTPALPTTGSALPLSAGVWPIDPAHSGVYFQVRHLGLTNVRGRFDLFNGTLTIGETLADVAIDATIDMASVNTNQPDRDAHLRSTDFFDVEHHPTMYYRSLSVTESEDGYQVDGELTINGTTQPVTLTVEFNGVDVHPADGRTRAGFAATTEIRRSDYGIDFNMPLGAGKLALSDKIKIDLDLQFIAP